MTTASGDLVLVLHAVLGAWLGARSFPAGLAVLVAFVGTTSGLYWHIGIGNLVTVEVYLFFLLVGAGAARLIHGGPFGKGSERFRRLSRALAFFGLTLVVATAVALVRDAADGAPAAPLAPMTVLRQLLAYSATGLAGQLRTVFVAVIGPAVLLLAVHSLHRATDRRLLHRAFVAGLTLAVVAPAVQAIWFNPWGRPDIGADTATGVSGLFHDPHSHAAYLVLGFGLVCGSSIGLFRGRRWLAAGGLGGLGAAVGAVLLATNSRTGLLTAFLAAVSVAVLTRARASTKPLEGQAWARVVIVVAVLGIGAGGLLLASTTLGNTAYAGISRFADMRMWDPLRSEEGVWSMTSAQMRVALWRKAGILIAQRPLWGVGPQGFANAPVPLIDYYGNQIPDTDETANVHNYFLQVATEYGLPALGALLSLLVLSLAVTARAARRSTDVAEQGMLAGIFAAQVGFLFMSMATHPMLLAEIQGMFWSLAGLGVAVAAFSPHARPRSVRRVAAGNEAGAPEVSRAPQGETPRIPQAPARGSDGYRLRAAAEIPA